MVLIDCGYTGFLPYLEQAIEKNNLSCKDLTHVLITHQDHDHMGDTICFETKIPADSGYCKQKGVSVYFW